jgi:hypothetical protein
MPGRNRKGEITFADYPEFRPNMSPKEMFKAGSFGGTYWRPIYSSVNKKHYKNQHHKYPKSWWKGIPEHHLTNEWDNYDTNINTYKEKVGTTLEYWEEKDWIHPKHPYGWVQWYCDFYIGERSEDDERQISRWKNLAGPKGRFRTRLIGMIKDANTTYDDISISPGIRQTLQHWGYVLTKQDAMREK